jgi:hypothetical protein
MYWVRTPPLAPSDRDFNRLRRGSAVTPYPDPANIYHRSAITNPGDDMFEDVYLLDL